MRPCPALAGTVDAQKKLLPPASGTPLTGPRLPSVQPTVSKPSMRAFVLTPATPTRMPNVSVVWLATIAPRGLSFSLLSVYWPCATTVTWVPGLSKGRALRRLTVPAMPPSRVEGDGVLARSEEHTSELQSLMRISYAVFCLKKKTTQN